jgi:predicted glycosyltransferase
VFYSHDGYGLGHLKRTVFLAQCVRKENPDLDIVIVTSSPAALVMESLGEFEYIKLPAVVKLGVERYRPHRLRSGLAEIIKLRSELLLSTVKCLRPQLFLVDHRPLGLKGEVAPTLRWLRRALPYSRTIVGLRDVVDEQSVTRQEWKRQGIYQAMDEFYDRILVYGQKATFDVASEYALPPSTAAKIRYTGYLGRGAARQSGRDVRRELGLTRERLVVVHAGGGGDGFPLLETYLRATAQLPEDVCSLVVVGPLADQDDLARLRQLEVTARVKVVEYLADLHSYIAAADLSISMGGYNTVCEVLSAGVPAIIVPRVFPRQEQYIRAQRLAARGLVHMLAPTALTPSTLATRVVASLLAPRPLGEKVALDGGKRAVQLMMAQRAATDRLKVYQSR